MISRQAEHTSVAPNQRPSMAFGEMVDVLMALYAVRESERVRFVARLNKVQRAGVPIGTNKGKGSRVRYDLDQFFQMLIVLELAELSISLNNAAAIVLREWPHFTVSMAIAQAWLQRKEKESVLLLASASELEGFAEHADYKTARDAEARRFLVSAPERPVDGLRYITATHLIQDGRFDLNASSLTQRLWRTSIVDMSTLVPLVMKIVRDRELVTDEGMTEWARRCCEDYEKAD